MVIPDIHIFYRFFSNRFIKVYKSNSPSFFPTDNCTVKTLSLTSKSEEISSCHDFDNGLSIGETYNLNNLSIRNVSSVISIGMVHQFNISKEEYYRIILKIQEVMGCHYLGLISLRDEIGTQNFVLRVRNHQFFSKPDLEGAAIVATGIVKALKTFTIRLDHR